MPISLQLMKEIRGSLANLFGTSLQYVSHWKDASGERSSDNTMTIAEFNAFTRDIIGVPLQEKMSKVLGYNASVRNSLWQYSQRDNTINKNFFALAVTLRNREVIRGSWDDTREAKFQQLRGNAGDEFPQALLSDMMDYGGKGYKEYDRMRDERTNAGVEKLLDGQTRIIDKLDETLSLLKGKVETPDLVSDLSPETSADDAAKFAARLVCHVWLTMPGMSKGKATDYVFQRARDGDSLFADCKYARSLVVKYGRNESTVAKDAARLHSRFNSWRMKSKKPYMPNIWRELSARSKAAEDIKEQQ